MKKLHEFFMDIDESKIDDIPYLSDVMGKFHELDPMLHMYFQDCAKFYTKFHARVENCIFNNERLEWDYSDVFRTMENINKKLESLAIHFRNITEDIYNNAAMLKRDMKDYARFVSNIVDEIKKEVKDFYNHTKTL